MNFERALQLRWSDMDPNMHIRHSVYYDFGAQIRTEYLYENGLTPQLMMKHNIGPVLFREEAMFRKELRFGDDLVMNLMVVRLKKDGSRFSIRHEIKKEGRVCATLNIDGAWIDQLERKLTVPPEIVFRAFDRMPKAEDFEWVE
jgi:acyl-CoA thioester hydrolase